MALGPRHHSLGLRVADNRLFGLVPSELAAEDVGQIAEDAQVGHADPGFDVHDRLGAGFDAVEPVFLMARALVHVLRAGRRLPLAGLFLDPRAAVAAPVDEFAPVAAVDGAVAGPPDLAARFVAGSLFRRGQLVVRHLSPGEGPIGIPEGIGHVHQHGAVPQALGGRGARGFDGGRAGAVGAHPPHGAAHHVRAAVANLPAAGLEQPAEYAVAVFLVVRPPAQRAQPHIPVQFGRRIAVRHRVVVLRAGVMEAIDPADFADVAVD